MKRLICIIIGFAFAVGALAQTAEEILAKMEEVFDRHEEDGVSMVVETKIPILGTISAKTWVLGNKTRMDTKMLGRQLMIWDDGVTEYTYDVKGKELTIADGSGEPAEDSGDLEMFSGIADGYDVSISKQTADAWYILCKKSKSNTEEGAPETMDLAVAKGTYHPISLSTKVEGVKMTMKDLKFGVSEEEVTFDISRYRGIKINDKRKK